MGAAAPDHHHVPSQLAAAAVWIRTTVAGYPARMSAGRTPVDDLLHRINNLLGTIQLQCEAARVDGGLQAAQQALRLIEESAARTSKEVQSFRQGRQDG